MTEEQINNLTDCIYSLTTGSGLLIFKNLYLPNDFILNTPINIVSGIHLTAFILGSFVYLKNELDENKTKHIRLLYDEFLNNYIKLCDELNITNPTEMYCMYEFLLQRGFLSYQHKFKYDSSRKYLKHVTLEGSTILTGYGVCRHIAPALADIYTKKGYHSKVIAINSRNYVDEQVEKMRYENQDEEITKENIKRYINSMVTGNKANKIFQRICHEITEGTYEESTVFKQLTDVAFGNHVITYVNKDNIAHFFDPTNSRIYQLIKEPYLILSDEFSKYPLKLIASLAHNPTFKRSPDFFDEFKDVQCPSKEEEEQIIHETLAFCEKNIDAFEYFYQDNCEIYQEVSNKINQLTKTNKLL